MFTTHTSDLPCWHHMKRKHKNNSSHFYVAAIGSILYSDLPHLAQILRLSNYFERALEVQGEACIPPCHSTKQSCSQAPPRKEEEPGNEATHVVFIDKLIVRKFGVHMCICSDLLPSIAPCDSHEDPIISRKRSSYLQLRSDLCITSLLTAAQRSSGDPKVLLVIIWHKSLMVGLRKLCI